MEKITKPRIQALRLGNAMRTPRIGWSIPLWCDERNTIYFDISVEPRHGLLPDEAPHYIGKVWELVPTSHFVGDRNLCTNLCSDLIADSDLLLLMERVTSRFHFIRAEVNPSLNFDRRARWKN